MTNMAFNRALGAALHLMDAEQLVALLAEVEKDLAATAEVHDRRGRPEHLARLIDGYKIVQFRITQEIEITNGKETRAKQLRFVCVQCEGFPFDPTFSDVCIACGSISLIEVDRIEPR